MKMIEKLLINTGDMALKRRVIHIIKGLELSEGDKILDVGCGDGYYLHIISNLGIKLQLTGVDSSRYDLKRAKKNLSGKKITLKYGDLMKKLPFNNDFFDKVVISEVVEHLTDDVRGLKEVGRVLKRGGILCLTVPNHNYPFLWDPVNWLLERIAGVHIKSGFFAGLWNQHERLYRPQEIKKVVEKSGFKVKEVKYLTWWCLPFNHHIVNIVARLLALGNLSNKTTRSLSKYSKNPKRSWYLDFAFGVVNQLDKLNDFWQPNNSGVSIYITAYK